jgi:hypothetical protein
MICSQWCPNGRIDINISEGAYRQRVITKLRDMVRETAYNLARIEADQLPQDETYSRAVCLRQQAADTLRDFDPASEKFIESTYHTKAFLHS